MKLLSTLLLVLVVASCSQASAQSDSVVSDAPSSDVHAANASANLSSAALELRIMSPSFNVSYLNNCLAHVTYTQSAKTSMVHSLLDRKAKELISRAAYIQNTFYESVGIIDDEVKEGYLSSLATIADDWQTDFADFTKELSNYIDLCFQEREEREARKIAERQSN